LDSLTFDRLRRLHTHFGPRVFGKVAQKLLALAFAECGFCHVVEREVQGVDIDIAGLDEQTFALEVKTTTNDSIFLSQENIQALEDRAKDGYVPLVAALRIRPLEEWMLAAIPLTRLQPGSMPLTRLRAYRLKELEQRVNAEFQAMIGEYYHGLLDEGEAYLNEVMQRKRSIGPQAATVDLD